MYIPNFNEPTIGTNPGVSDKNYDLSQIDKSIGIYMNRKETLRERSAKFQETINEEMRDIDANLSDLYLKRDEARFLIDLRDGKFDIFKKDTDELVKIKWVV